MDFIDHLPIFSYFINLVYRHSLDANIVVFLSDGEGDEYIYIYFLLHV